MADVNEVLQNISDKQREISELADVDRPLVFDVGTLTAWDPDSIVMPKAGTKRDDYFRKLARDDTQVILNRLYANVDSEGTVEIPEPTIAMPRGKSVPQPKPPTKWEQFATRKGIKSNKNREKKVWDEETQKWVPRYGYKKVQHDREKNWVTDYKERDWQQQQQQPQPMLPNKGHQPQSMLPNKRHQPQSTLPNKRHHPQPMLPTKRHN